jgi:hypothetical protein
VVSADNPSLDRLVNFMPLDDGRFEIMISVNVPVVNLKVLERLCYVKYMLALSSAQFKTAVLTKA